MPANTKIGLLVPGGFGDAPPSMAEFTGFFRRADEIGYDSLWVIDRIFHNISIIEPMTLLTCAAAVTERVRLGTAVLLFVLRNPILVAKTTATLDYLSGGRLTLGISSGRAGQRVRALGRGRAPPGEPVQRGAGRSCAASGASATLPTTGATTAWITSTSTPSRCSSLPYR